MADNFNYDNDDQELDENGLPIYTDEDEEGYPSDGDDSSLSDTIDEIRESRKKKKAEDEDNPTEGKKKSSEKGEGGRYGDKNSPTTSQKPQSQATKPSSGPKGGAQGDNWFSKLLNKGGTPGSSTSNLAGSGSKLANGAKGAEAAAKAAGAGAKAASATAGAGAGAGSGILSALGPALPYIGIALLIILLIVFIVCIISAVVAFFNEKTDPENMKSNSYITDEFFYGTRSVYIDEEALSNSLQLSYKQYAIDVFEDILTDNPSITFAITIPEEYDNSTELAHINEISLGIANIVATNGASSTYQGIEFSTLYPQIKYFGLTLEQGQKVNDFLTEYSTTNSLLTVSEGSIDINNLIDTAMAKESLQYIYNRCEKVMIKDEIASAVGLEDIEQRNYIASIYMPNKDILITKSVYTVAGPNDEFTVKSKLIEFNNGNETILAEKETASDADIVTGISSNSKNIKQFQSIDAENTTAFSDGLSLFEAIRMNSNYINYFKLNAETNVYTWMPTDDSLYYLTFEDASSPFIFTDFDFYAQLP